MIIEHKYQTNMLLTQEDLKDAASPSNKNLNLDEIQRWEDCLSV